MRITYTSHCTARLSDAGKSIIHADQRVWLHSLAQDTVSRAIERAKKAHASFATIGPNNFSGLLNG